jgi:predicted DNA-binding helix-hairpin-helix protein
MDTHEKLRLLADASRYDLSCACGQKRGIDHRRRGPGGVWLYPASVPRGGQSIMLKTLLSNACVNDCRYCPFRAGRDIPRCTLTPEEVAQAFMEYVRQKQVSGLFLTSGVIGTPDGTMDRMVSVARLLRQRYEYRGVLHLKVIPGASDAAIEAAVAVASIVSLNVEAPTRSAFRALATTKDYDRDIVRPVRLISRLTGRGCRYGRVRQMTQFIVGAADETDADIVRATFGLYRRLGLDRVYFSAYQRGLGDPSLPGERRSEAGAADLFMREHRLYQADFLIRKYRWDAADIGFEADGSLSLTTDPKQRWADAHPEFFPVRLRSADRWQILRVPGVGPVTAGRVVEARRGGVLHGLGDVGLRGKRLLAASRYVVME